MSSPVTGQPWRGESHGWSAAALSGTTWRGWQRKELSTAEAFWREALAGFATPTPLGIDRGAGAEPQERAEPCRYEYLLPAKRTSALAGFARRHRLTLNTVIQGGWALLLSRYSGEEDMLFGATVSGRSPELAGVEEMVGLFINTLPVRVRLEEDARVEDWLARLQAQQVEARQHEHAPLADVQRWSEVPAGLPLFESIVVFENHPVHEAVGGGGHELVVERWVRVGPSHYPLALCAIPGERMVLELQADPRRVEPDALRRAAGHLEVLLEGMTGPGRRMWELSLLREGEREQLLAATAAAGGPPEPAACLHDLFARQAERTAGALAVVAADGTLTYGELALESARLANRLRRLGVGPEVRVGVCLERGAGLAVALLGILRAGGVYLPLDPASPPARLASMLADSDAAVLVSGPPFEEALSGFTGARVSLERDRATLAGESPSAPGSAVSPENAAYVIYTSGSTGAPRGVVVTHASAAGLLARSARAFAAGPGERVLQATSPGFDASLLEIFVGLLSGAALHVADRETVLSPGRLAALLREREIGVWVSTPALLDSLPDADFPALRAVSTGGEGCSAGTAARWSVGRRLVNMYGPTETTIYATAHPCEPGAAVAPPIGRPVAGVRVHVLDARGEPVPIGVPGELYVGGTGVARGYLGRPDLTAERFVPDALSGEVSARTYRTGDRVRWLPSGELEYLGRADAQLKIRGVRIEPGEVEAALLRQPGVREAAVVAREDVPGRKRLVAYLVPEPGAAPSPAELRAGLAVRLPEHMVPAAFVTLQRLPLTAGGKLDRRALPAPERRGDEAYMAPGGEVEEALCAVLAETLRLERVGVNESFFELGGDSILSIEVVSRARRRGLRLTPRQLFEHPAVSTLARVVEREGPAAAASQDTVAGEAPLTPIQRRFFAEERPSRHHFNQALLLVPARPLHGELVTRAVAALVTHHDALRLRFRQAAGGAWTTAHEAPGAPAPVTVFDLSGLPAGARKRTLEAAADQVQRSLHIACGPLLRVGWFEPGGGEPGRLLVAAHHLVVDGVSWRILLEDLESACAQLVRGEPVRLPPKTAAWKEWAERLARYAGSGAVRAEAVYWREQAAMEVARLPLDDPSGEDPVADARSVAVALSAEETEALLREVPAAYRTRIDDVLLCALAAALARWTGELRVRLELEGHGREEETVGGVDVSRTVGWFTTLYPVVLELPECGRPGVALRAVKERLRAVPGRGIGYGLLRWGPGENAAEPAGAPGAEVSFNYLGQLDGSASADAFFAFAEESAGAEVDGRSPRSHRLEVVGAVRGGRLEMRIGYGAAVLHRETAERLAAWYGEELRRLIEHCRAGEAGGCTPSDFPLAGLAQAELDALLGSGRGVEDVYPLTPMQEGMLFHTLYAPGSGVYVGQTVFVLEGELDPEALERAWRAAVARHEALRAGIAWEGLRRPLQVVRREVEVPFGREDWRGQGDGERRARLERLLAEDRAEGFDPGRPPLMRLRLLRTGEEQHQLVWTHHLLALDGWSQAVLLRDVLALYAAGRRGQTAAPAPVRRYRDHVAWLERQDLGRAERYWREVLAGIEGPTPLPVLRSSAAGAVREGHGAARAHLSADATRALQERARQWGVTPSTLVQGAWGLLLARYAGEEDVVFGATVAGRPAGLAGVEEMVGLFINTLPVRVRPASGATVRAWLESVQREQARAREYDYAPLVQVQRWSGVPAGEPLFESLVVFENYPVDRALREGAEGLRMRPAAVLEQANYPLVLSAHLDARLHLELRYDGRLTEVELAGRMLAQLETVLTTLAADPERRLSEVGLLSGDERARLLEACAPGPGHPPACVHELFARQAALAPDAPAVVSAGRILTYAELDRASARLACHLARRGVGPETRVGLCLERSPKLVVAVLGVLRAGGAYVPLDPAYPPERLALTLSDSGASLLLSEASLLDAVPGFDGEAVLLDPDRASIDHEPDRPPPDAPGPRNSAYVVYTSGSTGRPKGVTVEHASVVNTLLGARDTFEIRAGEVSAVLASCAFDIWAFEALLPLLSGGAVRLLPREAVVDVERLVGELAEVDLLHAVPALMREIVQRVRSGPGTLPRVRHVFVGGDVVSPDLPPPMRSAFPGARMWALYGPTEGTIICAAIPLRADGGNGWQAMGRPLPGAGLYVCDAAGNPLPAGVPGELWIGGAGVARGYLGRPDLTAERFVPDPFGSEPGARLYGTGDRVRRRADGELEFLGRVDQQVKVRGFRIEPGEIEAALRLHPAVRDAVVVLREDIPGEPRLVAYVASGGAGNPPAAVAELRASLRERLPEHMVPAAVVVLEALPRTPTGKFDRRALPPPDGAGPEREYSPPVTATQRAVAAVWEEVLGIGRVGVDDSFFDLGGHSLLLVRVHARLRERFPGRVELIDLFEQRTLGALARHLDRGGPPGGAAERGHERAGARLARLEMHRARPGRR